MTVRTNTAYWWRRTVSPRRRPLKSFSAAAIVVGGTYYAFGTEARTHYLVQQQQHQADDEEDHASGAGSTPMETATSRIVALPRRYDTAAVQTYWSHRPVTTGRRWLEIATQLTPLVGMGLWDFWVMPRLVHWYHHQHQRLTTAVSSLFSASSASSESTDVGSSVSLSSTTALISDNENGAKKDDHKEINRNNDIINSDNTNNQFVAVEELQRKHAVAWRLALTALGPAFVKAGQQLSIRPDILPAVVLAELQQLCDAVEPVPDAIALELLRQELKVDRLDQVFCEPPVLVAAASLGQVYKARLRLPIDSNTNDQKQQPVVAIKVQRPDMLTKFSLDLYLLQRIGAAVDVFTSLFTKQPPFHTALYDSFASGSYSELDYENEAANQSLFRSELAARSCPVVIPKVYGAPYTTRTVLTTEWMEGIRLADASPEQIQQLIPVGVEMFLTQLLDIGHFHADPHVGNLLVLNESGKLCLLDFGLCAEISKQDRLAMTAAILHLLQRDFEALVHIDSKALGFLPESFDTTELLPLLTKILTVGLILDDVNGKNNDMSSFSFSRSARQGRHRKILEISKELNEVFFAYPFTVPPFFALVTRGLGLLEGIALSGDADFDIFQAAAPYARRRAVQLLKFSNG